MNIDASNLNQLTQRGDGFIPLNIIQNSGVGQNSTSSANTTAVDTASATNSAAQAFDPPQFLTNFASLFGQNAASSVQNPDGSVNAAAVASYIEQALGGQSTNPAAGDAGATDANSKDTTDGSIQNAFAALLQNANSGADNSAATATTLTNNNGDTGLSNIVQQIFASLDTSGTGSITQPQLEQAVEAGGGTAADADALYAKLDPNNTGSVSEQQFVQDLTPQHHQGHHHPEMDNANDATSTDATAAVDASNTGTSQTTAASPDSSAANALAALTNPAQLFANLQSLGGNAQLFNFLS